MALALVLYVIMRFLPSSKKLNLIQPANPLISMKKSKFISSLLPASPFFVGAHLGALGLLLQSVEPLIPEAEGDAIKADLKKLDAQIDRVDELVENARTPEEKAAAKARLDALKERFAELTHDFRQARFDALRGRRKNGRKESGLVSGLR
jgi:hypothetical protein